MQGAVRAPLITLLTDFGLEDGYVAAMKGVIASLAPGVPVVDICHEIPPQDIRRGGLVWAAAARFFPAGTVHVGVVDPGVGSRRRILALEARKSIFVAPDNGLVSYVLERREIRALRRVTARELFRRPVSRTFHGRDIFAPVAARLATGLPLSGVGPLLDRCEWHGLPRPRARSRNGRTTVRGEVVDVDRFGNLITNLSPRRGATLERLEVAGRRIPRLSASYASVRPGRLLALVGSLGSIEIAVSMGSAAGALGISTGTPVVGVWRSKG